MPVVINEFEVVPETSSTSATAGAPAPAADAGKQAQAPDVERVLMTRRARELRVRAY